MNEDSFFTCGRHPAWVAVLGAEGVLYSCEREREESGRGVSQREDEFSVPEELPAAGQTVSTRLRIERLFVYFQLIVYIYISSMYTDRNCYCSPCIISKMLSHSSTDAMNAYLSPPSWDGTERRSQNSCRRKTQDRRRSGERRRDPRDYDERPRLTFLAWLRSKTRFRLGVDRRKGREQRLFERRCSGPRSLLSQEELEALLK